MQTLFYLGTARAVTGQTGTPRSSRATSLPVSCSRWLQLRTNGSRVRARSGGLLALGGRTPTSQQKLHFGNKCR